MRNDGESEVGGRIVIHSVLTSRHSAIGRIDIDSLLLMDACL